MTNRRRLNHDLLLSVATFALVALAAGRIYRFPFDDEITTLYGPDRSLDRGRS